MNTNTDQNMTDAGIETTIVYDPIFDDLDYKELIAGGYVLNDNGEVSINIPNIEEMKKRSVLSVEQVVSGRGMFDAWKSNMQKCIRRGKYHEAKQSFIECGMCGGQFLSNIVNRLCRTISVEDIGIANVNVISEAVKVLDYYEKHKKDGFTDELREKGVALIKLMCASPKSRSSDVLYHYLKTKYKDSDETAEQLFIKLAWRLKQKNYEEACFYARVLCEKHSTLKPISGYKKSKLFSRKKKIIYDVFSAMLQSNHSNQVVKNVIYDLVKLFELKEGDDWMLLVNCGILCVCFNDKITTQVPLEEVDEKANYPVWIEDISYDKHTKIGRSLGRGIKFFWEYGCKLSHLSHIPEIAKLDEDLYAKMWESAQKLKC